MTKAKRNPNQQINDALDASDTEITVVDESETVQDVAQDGQNEVADLEELLYAGEAESKAQLAVSVKAYGWQVYNQVGAEYDAQMILEIAQGRLKSTPNASKSTLDDIAKRMNVRTPEQITTELEAKKEAFLKSQKKLTATRQKTLPKSKI